jgi:predicted outer membrane protein
MKIRAGKMAEANGGSQELKKYGHRLVRDHEAADRQLRQYARASTIDLQGNVPAPVQSDLQHAHARLQDISSW